jgi:hypothetical protein
LDKVLYEVYGKPPIQRVPGEIPWGVKRPRREADHSPPSNVKIKNGEILPPLPIRLHGLVLNFIRIGTTLPLPYDIDNKDIFL